MIYFKVNTLFLGIIETPLVWRNVCNSINELNFNRSYSFSFLSTYFQRMLGSGAKKTVFSVSNKKCCKIVNTTQIPKYIASFKLMWNIYIYLISTVTFVWNICSTYIGTRWCKSKILLCSLKNARRFKSMQKIIHVQFVFIQTVRLDVQCSFIVVNHPRNIHLLSY